MPRAPKRVWFLVLPGTGVLDVAGPWEVFGHANDVLGRVAYELEAVGPQAPVAPTRHGLLLAGVRPLPGSGRFRPPDVAIVAGGSPEDPLPSGQAPIVPWLVKHKRHIPTLVSICTGAFVLGAAGVLDGKRATTHWLYLAELQRRFPAARVVDEGIYVKDGAVWTSAGITAGIDLALAFVEEDHGHRVAMQVARRLVLFLRRSGHQAQFSGALQRQQKEPASAAGSSGPRDLATFVMEHLDEALAVERLAAGVGMSPRTLSRWCRDHLDESPAQVVRRLRLDEARRLLEETALPLKDIAHRTGLGDASTLWRAFTSRLGVTPAAYRERFAAPSIVMDRACAEGES